MELCTNSNEFNLNPFLDTTVMHDALCSTVRNSIQNLTRNSIRTSARKSVQKSARKFVQELVLESVWT